MATTKERILVTLTPAMAHELKAMAKRERTPRATIAAALMRRALEEEEDRYLSSVGDAVAANPGKLYSHEDVWGVVAQRGSK